jgi:MFS superfamily sulfate permease-like transporter
MIYNWFYKSYFKTKDKLEWLVVPLIVVAAFVLDLLSAVFLGLALSTFLFVAALFRSGVVKYVANGIVIHSTIERPFRSSEWLNENGDLIQVLVLQNYLFFGNASSVYNYIGILFQSHQNDSEMEDDTTNRRRPLFIVLDLTLVTGIDTSTVDVFNDINNLCASNKCKLFMAGLSSNLRTILSLGGFKVDETRERSKRQLRIFPSLDAALGKAEDNLLDAHSDEREAAGFDTRKRLLSEGDHGFRTALRHIDEEVRLLRYLFRYFSISQYNC